MKFHIYNGAYVGTVEWRGPGDVALDVDDAEQRAWLERYFHSEDSFLIGDALAAELLCERPDSSAQAFERACYRLSAYPYSFTGRAKAQAAEGKT